MLIQEVSPEEVSTFEEYCNRAWEHGGIVEPVSRIDLEKPVPPGIIKNHLLIRFDGDIAAGLTIQMGKGTGTGSYGDKHWLDMWIVEEYRGKIEEEIIKRCEGMFREGGGRQIMSRIPDSTSRFTDLFRKCGYREVYKEDTFIRETKLPLDEVILSYYEQSQKKVSLRVSKNLEDDMETYMNLINEISVEVPNMSPLFRDQLHSAIYEGKRHMIGIWIFAEVDTVPAGFIGGLVSFQKLLGKDQVVGKIINNGVLRSFRGMGIGTALYVKMIEEMRRWNTRYILDHMVMEDNTPERMLLKELGFTEAQKHVRVEKTLL